MLFGMQIGRSVEYRINVESKRKEKNEMNAAAMAIN